VEPQIFRNELPQIFRNHHVPQIGAIRPDLRRTLLAAQRAFRQAYHDALDRWRDGLRSVVFPLGTWWMKVFHGAAVAAPD
jgi:hypothetical protein